VEGAGARLAATIVEMRPQDIRKLLKQEPFEPIRLALSDGRSVVIRHPDQVVVSERYVYVGLARLERTPPLATPESGEAFPTDWILVNVLHVTSAEPLGKAG
jgi:hypothetical protein